MRRGRGDWREDGNDSCARVCVIVSVYTKGVGEITQPRRTCGKILRCVQPTPSKDTSSTTSVDDVDNGNTGKGYEISLEGQSLTQQLHNLPDYRKVPILLLEVASGQVAHSST